MHLRQFRYSVDNFSYLLFGTRTAMAIDGGAIEAILRCTDKLGLTLAWVTNTHSHPDHTVGNRELLSKTRAEFLNFSQLSAEEHIELDGECVSVIPTPGHTLDSVSFRVDGALITGDTLFNGTVGNCFSGDLESFYRSINRLKAFPAEWLVYAGHDYLRDAMAVARRLEPGNRNIDRYLKGYDAGHVVSTLGDELLVNPYLRYNEPGLIQVMHKRGLRTDTEYDRWESVMALE